MEAACRKKCLYIQGDLTKPELYEKLRGVLADAEKLMARRATSSSISPLRDRFFGTVVEQLGKAKLTDQNEDQNGKRRFWRRVVIEKPFGHSLDFGARAECPHPAYAARGPDLPDRPLSRKGHGPEHHGVSFRQWAVRADLEPRPHRSRADHRGGDSRAWRQRGKFYEVTGALRDMVPNHVFSLLSMVAMEPPTGFDAAAIRTKKAEVLAAMRAPAPRVVRAKAEVLAAMPAATRAAVRGQYGAGTVLGKQVKAYRQEPDVAPDSNVETYVAMRLEIDNWRWAGVPFYIRTGKHMSAPRIPRSRSASSRRPTRRSRTRRSTLCGPIGWCCASRRTRGFPAVRGQAPRAGGGSRRREDGLPLRRLVSEGAECRIRDAAL